MLAPLFLEVKMKLTEFHHGALSMYVTMGFFRIVGHDFTPQGWVELLIGFIVIVGVYLLFERLTNK